MDTINIGWLPRWGIRQALGTKRGNAVIRMIEGIPTAQADMALQLLGTIVGPGLAEQVGKVLPMLRKVRVTPLLTWGVSQALGSEAGRRFAQLLALVPEDLLDAVADSFVATVKAKAGVPAG